MNPPMPTPGGSFPFKPLWHPPIETQWIVTIILVFFGAVAGRIPSVLRGYVIQPAGFFLISLLVMVCLHFQYIPVAFALCFFLLAIWSAQLSSKEGFLDAASTVDWVTNSKRWFVEKVLKEKPVAIQEKDVSTYPVSGLSAQSSTSTGTT
jgi:hypothetical protein